MRISYLILLLWFWNSSPARESADVSDSLPSKACLRTAYWGLGLGYAGLGTTLYAAWYRDYPMQGFHFFNDNQEWMQTDKLGHAFSCYSETVAGIHLIQHLHESPSKALWVGGLLGMGMQTLVEVMDGFSTGWGFSPGDMGANILGTGLAMAQEKAWKAQRIRICFSAQASAYAPIRPEILGSNGMERLLKDYNGQTYWLSVNLHAFHGMEKIPGWLGLAIGHRATGMLTGDPSKHNIFIQQGVQRDYSYVQRHRIWYLSPDIWLPGIPYVKKHKRLLTLAQLLTPLKFPMPALQWEGGHMKMIGLYF